MQFLNDNNLTVSTFEKVSLEHLNLRSCWEQTLPCFGKKQLQSFQLHNIYFLFYSHSYYHRNTGIKVYSLDINIDVYGRAKLIGASNNICVDCIFTTRWQQEFKKCFCHWIIHSRDSFKNTDSSSNETSEVFMRVIARTGIGNADIA